MVAYMSRESLERTLATGEVHFWSRSRKTIWRKGETSGNVLQAPLRRRRLRSRLPSRSRRARGAGLPHRREKLFLPDARRSLALRRARRRAREALARHPRAVRFAARGLLHRGIVREGDPSDRPEGGGGIDGGRHRRGAGEWEGARRGVRRSALSSSRCLWKAVGVEPARRRLRSRAPNEVKTTLIIDADDTLWRTTFISRARPRNFSTSSRRAAVRGKRRGSSCLASSTGTSRSMATGAAASPCR